MRLFFNAPGSRSSRLLLYFLDQSYTHSHSHTHPPPSLSMYIYPYLSIYLHKERFCTWLPNYFARPAAANLRQSKIL